MDSGLGWLASFAHTLYVTRERRATTAAQKNVLADRLNGGGSIILFPEGTNGDGTTVLPFKSALFSVVDDVPGLIIQPVTLAYTRINNAGVVGPLAPHGRRGHERVEHVGLARQLADEPVRGLDGRVRLAGAADAMRGRRGHATDGLEIGEGLGTPVVSDAGGGALLGRELLHPLRALLRLGDAANARALGRRGRRRLDRLLRLVAREHGVRFGEQIGEAHRAPQIRIRCA